MAQRRSFIKPINSHDGDKQLTVPKAFYEHAPAGLWSITLKVGSGKWPAGNSWPVVLEQKQVVDPDNPVAKVFTDGWKQLHKDLKPRRKDLILFEKIERWEFEITVFSKSFTLKRPKESLFEDFEAEDDDTSSDESEGFDSMRIDLTENMSSRISLKKEFVLANNLNSYKSIYLIDEHNGRWLVNLNTKDDKSGQRFYIGRGWNDFWKSWDLYKGKIVILRFRRSNEVDIEIHEPEDFETESEEESS